MRSNLAIPWLIFLFSQLSCLLVSTQCLDSQRTLLLQLKNTLAYNSSFSTKLVNWRFDQTPDCCRWPGVACNVAGQVTVLDLSSELIYEGLHNSSTLFLALSFLENLNLANNTLNYTQIPTYFGNLTSLKTLNLSYSGVSGQIPIELSRLVNLETLDLSAFSLFETRSLILQKPDLWTLVENLTKIKELHLNGVNISSRGRFWSLAVSTSLPNLKVLSLENSFLSGPIDSSLGNLYNLSELYLGSNDLSGNVPEFFVNFVNLRVLSLSGCNLSSRFPSKIFKLPKLRVLNLEANLLLTGSLPEFNARVMIESLVLTDTKFSGILPNSIDNLKNLSRLELSGCHFSGPIPNSVANLSQLVYLDLQLNQFTGLVPSFQRLKNLVYIDLSHNALSGSVPSTHFEGLAKLVFVDFTSNFLNGSIPASLFTLPSLQKLFLRNNKFSGEIHEPKNKSFTPLDTLDISSNNLQGNIPEFLFGFKKMHILSLSFNNFSGLLHLDKFRNLGSLSSLVLSNNNLSIDFQESDFNLSKFPQLSELGLASCNLKTFPALMNQLNMITLDLSDNKITGNIPSWVWYGSLSYLNVSFNLLENLESPIVISSLDVIDLHFNRLKGEIPIPGAWTIYVDYSNNYFNLIPADIGNYLTFTTYFSVSNNSLSGPIPQSICSSKNLQVLDLSNNGFTGFIPRCLIENTTESLAIMNMGNNRLTGTIMGKFPKICALRTLDISRNRLEGTVPKSLVNCELLEVLNLRDNQMNDVFPCFLKTSSSLRVLVLRLNKFQGDIWCPNVTSVTWPKLQIIDLARNNFSGELPSDSFLGWKAMMGREWGPSYISYEFLMLNHYYYQDTVTITNKGFEMKLVKILTIYTSIDFSSNRFEGHIPQAIGNLRYLYVLNFSNNAFTNKIPSTLGNLTQLGSLDLSHNNLSGAIPIELTQLSFLSVLNLSYNHLVGKIPIVPHFDTFSESSYIGNPSLCGYPLKTTCTGGDSHGPLKTTCTGGDSHGVPHSTTHSSKLLDTEMLLMIAAGYVVGVTTYSLRFVFLGLYHKYKFLGSIVIFFICR